MAGISTTTRRDRHPQDVQALIRFELFYVAAVSTVVLVRAFLAATGYPRVGGGNLHVAHVLWGGLLMGVSVVVLEIFPGTRAQKRAALIGGIGFGLFIDEVGKFVTKDVNYFFKPAIAMIYIVFVALFLIVREVVLNRTLSSGAKLAVATEALADLALGQLHEDARYRALALLDDVDDRPELVAAMRDGLRSAPCVRENHVELRITAARNRLGHAVRRHLDDQRFDVLLLALLVVGAAGIVAEQAIVSFGPGGNGFADLRFPDYASFVSTAVSVLLNGWGHLRLRRGDRVGALQLLFRSTLVTILLTQVLVFFRYQLGGVIGLAGGLVLLAVLRVIAESARSVCTHVVPLPSLVDEVVRSLEPSP